MVTLGSHKYLFFASSFDRSNPALPSVFCQVKADTVAGWTGSGYIVDRDKIIPFWSAILGTVLVTVMNWQIACAGDKGNVSWFHR